MALLLNAIVMVFLASEDNSSQVNDFFTLFNTTVPSQLLCPLLLTSFSFVMKLNNRNSLI